MQPDGDGLTALNAPAPAMVPPPGMAPLNGGGAPSADELHELLHALQAVRVGDFSVRLPGHRVGLIGKIADTFNDIVAANQRMAQQLEKVGQSVGREGKTRQRVRLAGLSGAWAEMESSVNTLIDDLLWPTTEVTRAIAAVAQGDLLQTVRLDVDGRPLKGEFLRSASIVNTMIKQLGVFTSEVTRVAREVGTDGKLGGQAQVREVTGVWKDLTESVNSMASNLTAQVRNIAEVTIAVANGDLSKKITVDVRGEILQLKEAINTMVDQLRSFASEVTRVAREVGTDGKLGGQAIVPGVAGTWKDLTDSVNAMCGNLTDQVRNIAQVTTAVARGDLSRKITVDVRGEILELKDTINTMVDQLNAFASEVTRVAREVGTEGELGGQAQVPGVAGTWKDLTDNVNFMAGNLTAQVRNIAEVATAIAGGDLSKKITVNVSGEILQLKETVNTMVDQLNAFASEVTRVAREVGTEGRLGGQANVLGRRRHLEGPHRHRQLDGQQPDGPGPQHRRGLDRDRQRRPLQEDHRRRARRDPAAQGDHQHHGRPAQRLRLRGDARRARGRHRGQARRPGAGARRRRHLEGPHRQRQLDGQQPDRPGAQHRRGGDRGRPRRPLQEDHGRMSAARSCS
jgi:HAMP domain-containing protein